MRLIDYVCESIHVQLRMEERIKNEFRKIQIMHGLWCAGPDEYITVQIHRFFTNLERFVRIFASF